MSPQQDDDLALALRLADAADELTIAAFTGAAVAHEIKPDGSPVSAVEAMVWSSCDPPLMERARARSCRRARRDAAP